MSDVVNLLSVERDSTGTLRISSEQIAEGSGVQHKNVLELISVNRDDFEAFGEVAFETRPGYNNAKVRVAMLNEQQATLLMTFQRNTEQVRRFKVALVKAFYEMAKALAAPALTGPELMATALIEAQATLQAKDKHIAELTPRAEAFDSFLATTGDVSVNEAAKILSRDRNIMTGEKRLRDWMHLNGWLYRDGDKKPRAYQTRVDQGLLAEKAQWHYHPETGEKVMDAPQVRVTAKGIDALAKALTSKEPAV